VQSIQQALKEAEMMADCKITRVYTASPAATSAAELDRHGDRARQGGDAGDVARVVETAKRSTSRTTSGCCWSSRRSS